MDPTHPPTDREAVANAQSVLEAAQTEQRAFSQAWWISVAAACISFTVLAIAVFTVTAFSSQGDSLDNVTQRNEELQADISDLQAQLADSRIETSCRAQKIADLEYAASKLASAQAVLDTTRVSYDIAFNDVAQSLLANDDVAQAQASAALDVANELVATASASVVHWQVEVDIAAEERLTSVQDCALTPVDTSDDAEPTTPDTQVAD